MNILILDGQPSSVESGYYDNLSGLRKKLVQKGHGVKILTLRDQDIRFCTGCWSCWWGTPGECVFKDESHTVCREYINSDFVLFVSPMIMGFPSTLLKKTLDKLIPLLHPYLDIREGETRHRKRYDAYPQLGLLLEKTKGTDDEDIEITENIFKRFALNFVTELAFTAQMTQSPQEVCDAIDSV